MHSIVLPLLFLTVGIWYISSTVNFAEHNTPLPTPIIDLPTPIIDRTPWINPEQLPSMPQCIAQQDPTAFLTPLTHCTHKQCTRHFGIICTHHQWLTETSCLSTSFTPYILKHYLFHCSRSVLAKAQLLSWIHLVTGRTWFVDVGDAWDVQPRQISTESLVGGYKDIGVMGLAPTCLIDSASAVNKKSVDSFHEVIASCGFEATAHHMGNKDRPWEYNQGAGSIVALDFETVGYNDLTRGKIEEGDYFDRECVCKSFRIEDGDKEPCKGPGLDLTKERLWLRATCAKLETSSPYWGENWTHVIRFTPSFEYIPIEKWSWPRSVSSLSNKVLGMKQQCTTDVCALDSEGYCSSVKYAVDRSCFCRNINYYDTCKGSCRNFENRIEYVQWLLDVCGAVPAWNSLPKHWLELARPTAKEMTPWDWDIKSRSSERDQSCVSTDWILGGLVLVNVGTFLAVCFSPTENTQLGALFKFVRQHSHSYSKPWIPAGMVITFFYLASNFINAVILQTTPGYQHVPNFQLLLLWCTLPRFNWAMFGIVTETSSTNTVYSLILAEIMLQILASPYILRTVIYGIEHGIYTARYEPSQSAWFVYTAALIWIFEFILITLLFLLRRNVSKTRNAKKDAEATSLLNNQPTESQRWKSYGTLPTVAAEVTVEGETSESNEELEKKRLYGAVATISFCITQWCFWYGALGLMGEEFCLPRFGMLVLVWTVASLGVLVVVRGV